MTESSTSAVKTKHNLCLIVLGPHRSGTSALTGVLSKLGADIPKSLMVATEANPKGYFESQKIMQFNDRLLADLGSQWDDIAPLTPAAMLGQVLASHQDEATQLLKDEFSAARLPLLKDPRICRLVGFWRNAFKQCGYTPVFIHTHRNPLETAKSLHQRDGIPIEVGLLIWQRHVIDAEAATRGAARVFTSYQNLLGDWSKELRRVEEAAGFSFHRNTPSVRRVIEQFLQKDLRHQVRESSDVYQSSRVADVVRETFQILDAWACGNLKPEDYDRLDQVRSRMDGAVDQVSTLVQALSETRSDFGIQEKGFQQRILQLSAEKAEIVAELELVRRETSVKAALLDERIVELEQVAGRLKAQQSEAQDEAEQVQESLRTSLRERDNNIRVLERNIQIRFDELAQISGILLETENLVQKLKQDLEVTKSKASEERAKVTELLSSTSWRLTGPMRKSVTTFRRYRNLFRVRLSRK